jgi:hypothetical protein
VVDLDVSVAAELTASLDGLGSSLGRLNKNLERAQQAFDHAPSATPIAGQGATGTSGACMINCGGPNLGRIWQVRNLVLGGAGLTAGIAYIYALGAPPLTTPLQIAGMKDTITFATFPVRSTFYSTRQFVVLPLEQLFVVVTGATHTKTVHVTGQAEDYDFAAYHGVTSL